MMTFIVSLLVVSVPAVWFAVVVHRKSRRRILMSAPFPEAWSDILVRNLPPYASLPEALRLQLQGYINVFLAEKHFEGCGGQDITDEVKVTIAAQACLLLIGRDSTCYPKLCSVLVYPHTYVAGGKSGFGGQGEPPSARLGESWQHGVVVLSWNSVKGGATNFDDGHNVTLHEFAHQLDQEDGAADGTPILEGLTSYRSWAHSLSDEYRSFLKRTHSHRKTVMDRYGATNPAEFFAVASETFFEKPEQLMRKRPKLYEELKQYYKVDPLTWS
jgi:Mlc titration factor MtfA (ptsG expression regulator)